MKVVIYVSYFDENDPVHGLVKVDQLKAYAEGEGHEVVRIFKEKIDSVSFDFLDLMQSTLLDECMDFCCSQHPDMLLVPSLSCLGRLTYDIIQNIDTLTKAGVSVCVRDLNITTLQPDGTQTPEGSLMLKVLKEAFEIDNEYYRMRLKAGRERYKLAGGRLGRPKGTGMTPDETFEKYPSVAIRLAVNEKEGTKETIDAIAHGEGVSPSTVKKVKRAKIAWQKRMAETKEGVMSFYDEMMRLEEAKKTEEKGKELPLQ